MEKVKVIVNFINDIEDAEYKSQIFSDLDDIINDIVNQIDLKSKVEYPKNIELQNLSKELQLINVIRNLSTEMLMQRLKLNSNIEFVNKILKQK
jgi:hypothetical protein